METEENQITETPEATSVPTGPSPTPEQLANQQKMAQISLEVGQAYLQDAARLLANVAGAMGSPLSFAYDTQSGGKALVFALSGDTQLVAQVVRVIEAVIATVAVAPTPAEAPSEAVEAPETNVDTLVAPEA